MIDRRVNLAQELHDGIAQDLVGLGYSIDALIANSEDLLIKQSLRAIRFTISELIEKVRLEIHQLRSSEDLLQEETQLQLTFELLRTFAEILQNISKHSQATQLIIEISDNGIGGAHEKSGSFGLMGIRERVTGLHGDIHIDSSEIGTKIRIQIPLES